MNTMLEGQRIYLRPITEADANSTYLGWLNNTEVNRYLESRFSQHTIEGLKEYINGINRSQSYVFMAIVTKAGDRHIGNIKLGPIDRYHRLGDIGLIIGEKAYWGQGIATEAIALLADHAFNQLKLHKLTAGCYANNQGSAKAFLKVGFAEEARLKSQCLSDGVYVDRICLGMVNPGEAQ